MWCIKSTRLIDFLWERGLMPVLEFGEIAFYRSSADLRLLLESYYIRYVCIPNRKESF